MGFCLLGFVFDTGSHSIAVAERDSAGLFIPSSSGVPELKALFVTFCFFGGAGPYVAQEDLKVLAFLLPPLPTAGFKVWVTTPCCYCFLCNLSLMVALSLLPEE